MRKILLAFAAILLASPAAFAGGASTPAFTVGGLQGSGFSTTTTVDGAGTGAASSASGTNFGISAANGAFASFDSNGAATSTVTTTPFAVTSTSSHTAFSTATTTPGAAVSATNETFGQSNGTSAFTSIQTATTGGFSEGGFVVAGGNGGFEGGFPAP